jgi:two-component system OmpR family response regulator
MIILLIEDHPKLAANVATVLRSEGYYVDWAATAETARGLVETKNYDLVILDLGLPDGDGIELCQYFRAQDFDWPLLVLTARINLESKVESLDSGADDYLTKPFLMDELLARVRALMRRSSTQKTTHITLGDLQIDLRTKVVTKAGQPIMLSPTELKLLEVLLFKRGSFLSATEMYEKVWGDFSGDKLFSDTLKVTVARLRKKIGHQVITTLPGQGYGIR